MSLPLRDEIYNDLKKRILFGELSEGSILKEREVVKHYLTSRTPVREALEKLEVSGLIVNLENEPGYMVRIIPYSDIEEIVLLFISCCKILSKDSIKNVTDEDIKEYYQIQAEARKNSENNELLKAANLCSEWKNRLFSKGGRNRSYAIYKSLPRITNFSWLWNGISIDRHSESIRDNDAMLDAVKNRQAAEFYQLYRRHMLTYLDWCVEAYQRNYPNNI